MSKKRNHSVSVSRRGFLGSAAAFGAASMTAPSLSAAIGKSDTINVGFIGLGRRGSFLLEQTSRLADSGKKIKVVGVCEIYDVRLQEAAKKARLTGKGIYRDYRALLKHDGLDAVVVATPDHWHARMTMDALKAGKDVYCEKPFTHTYEQARACYEEAEKREKVVQVGVTSCSDTVWSDAFKLIDDEKIGKILLTTGHHSRNSKEGEWNRPIDKTANPNKNLDWAAFLGPATKTSWEPERYFRWRNYWDYSGGIATNLFYQQLTHLILALGGTEYPEIPGRVSAFGGNYQFWDCEVPDTFTVQINYAANHTMVLVASIANDVGIREAIRGHLGTIFFEPGRLVLKAQDKVTGKKPDIIIKSRRKGGAYEHLENFFDCMRTRKEPACPAQLAYWAQVAISMAVLSYQNGVITKWHNRREEIQYPGSEEEK